MARFRSYGLRHERQLKRRRRIRVVISLILALGLTSFYFVSPRALGSDGMKPTLDKGDFLLTVPLAYGPRIQLLDLRLPGLGDIQRGDVVLAEPAYYDHLAWYEKATRTLVGGLSGGRWVPFSRGPWERSPIVKRVVGIPGDRIEVVGNVARIRPAGSDGYATEFDLTSGAYALDPVEYPENWTSDDPLGGNWPEVVVGPGQYYLLGDNRAVFHDSRTFGPVDESQILAKVVLRYWPRYAVVR